MISDTSHLFRQLQLAFCLREEKERRAWEWRGRRERRGETEGDTAERGKGGDGGLANKGGVSEMVGNSKG